jgi:predicted ATPase
VIEDLHWVDPSTLELIGLLVDQAATSRLFVLLTARPSFTPPWPMRTHATQLSLLPMTRGQTELMVHHVTRGKALPAEVLQQVVAKTDGVPLFAEELTKLLLESGLLRDTGERYQLVGALPAMAVPSTLQDSLMARLDRLAPTKAVAQLAATLGREFSWELLRAVATVDDETLRQELARLVEAELIYQRGLPPHSTYVFKHALIQDAAYQALLKSTRQLYHQQIADVLAARFPDTVATQPEILAYHCTQAGLTTRAIEYWKRAGERALRRSAYLEAIAHLSKGLELLAEFFEGADRIERELELRVAIGPALSATRGQSSPEVQAAYGRAWELCQQLGDTPQLFPVLIGLRRFYSVRADLATAHSIAQQLLTLARATGDPVHLIEAYLAFGNTSLWRGELRDALGHLEQGIAATDAQAFPPGARAQLVSHPFVTTLGYLSWALWATGAVEQARARSRQSIDFARGLDHPHSLAVALDFAAALEEFRGDGEAALPLTDEGIVICREHRFTFWLGLLTVRRGWAVARLGNAKEGLAETRAGIEIWEGTGAELARPFLLALLAETLTRAGMVEEALDALRRALTQGELTGERFYEAEVGRLTGMALLSRGSEKEAEAAFTRALEVARAQGARSFALRAALDLARLWQRRGAASRAHAVLAPECAAFREGFDTGDLALARVVLAELA